MFVDPNRLGQTIAKTEAGIRKLLARRFYILPYTAYRWQGSGSAEKTVRPDRRQLRAG